MLLTPENDVFARGLFEYQEQDETKSGKRHFYLILICGFAFLTMWNL